MFFIITCNEDVSNATIHWTADMLQCQSLCNSVRFTGIGNSRHVSLMGKIHTSLFFIYQRQEKTYTQTRREIARKKCSNRTLYSTFNDRDTTMKTNTTMGSCCHMSTITTRKQQERNMFWYNHKTMSNSLRWEWLSAIDREGTVLLSMLDNSHTPLLSLSFWRCYPADQIDALSLTNVSNETRERFIPIKTDNDGLLTGWTPFDLVRCTDEWFGYSW
jgi:hypothetical protein